MEFITSKTSYISEPVVLCLGTFDGMHIGHQALIQEGIKIAKKNGYKTAVYSFDNIPSSYLFHETVKKNLFVHNEKVDAFKQMDVDYLWLDYFDDQIAHVSPKAYIDYLEKILNIKHAVVGFNYTFGDKAKGKPDDLKNFGETFGFDVTVLSPIKLDGVTVSSTEIRKFLTDGNVTMVNKMLGKPFCVSGIVIHGKKLGSKLGYPTININQEEKKIVPKFGVYATKTMIDKKEYPSITNVGVRPTIYEKSEIIIETNIFDYDEICYDKLVKISFLKFISDEVKLNSKEELKRKIDKDVKDAKKFFLEG